MTPSGHADEAAIMPVEIRRQVLRFDHQLLSYAHPDSARAWLLSEGVSESAAHRLIGCGRLQPRLAALMRRRLRLEACDPQAFAEAEARVALLEGAALDRLVHCVGAIWHGHRLRRIILAVDRAALHQRIDVELYRIALANLDLATDPEPAHAVPELLSAIEQDGRACLDAWSKMQEPAIGDRLRLKLPPLAPIQDDQQNAALQERGPQLVRRAVERLGHD